jgi:hypothetical protein
LASFRIRLLGVIVVSSLANPHRTHPRVAQQSVVPSPEEAGSLEAAVSALAASGEFAKIGKQEIRRLLAKGLPVTYQRGRHIIKKYADGREEVLGIVRAPEGRLPLVVNIPDAP